MAKPIPVFAFVFAAYAATENSVVQTTEEPRARRLSRSGAKPSAPDGDARIMADYEIFAADARRLVRSDDVAEIDERSAVEDSLPICMQAIDGLDCEVGKIDALIARIDRLIGSMS